MDSNKKPINTLSEYDCYRYVQNQIQTYINIYEEFEYYEKIPGLKALLDELNNNPSLAITYMKQTFKI